LGNQDVFFSSNWWWTTTTRRRRLGNALMSDQSGPRLATQKLRNGLLSSVPVARGPVDWPVLRGIIAVCVCVWSRPNEEVRKS
jgi:hypothetical protein